APYSVPLSTLAEGTYLLTVVATDSNGATGSAQVTIIVGNPPPVVNHPPSVVILSPAQGSYVAPFSGDFTALPSDSDLGDAISGVQFWLNGTLLGNVTAAPYSVPLSTLAEGTYLLTVVATDSNGATGSAQVTIIVGNPPPDINNDPVVDLIIPQPDTFYQEGDPITITAFGYDPNGDDFVIELLQEGVVIETCTTSPCSITLPGGLPKNTYVFWARITDAHGGVGTSSFSDVTVGTVTPGVNHVPIVIITSPANGTVEVAPADFLLTAIVYDPDGDAIVSVEFLVDGVSIGILSAPPYEVPLKFRDQGSHTLLVRAEDAPGDEGYSSPIVVNIILPEPNALVVCYSSLPPNTYGQGATLDPSSAPDTGAWIPYSDLPFDINGCATIPHIDGRIPFIWWDATNGVRAADQWYGNSLNPSSVTVNGNAYPVPLPFFDFIPGVGAGHFICLTPDCGLDSGYGHILLQLFPDADGDGVLNGSDNCKIYANDQTDSNSDGIGDACDGRDSDNDGYRDIDDAFPHDPSKH
ncbi:MAG: Ig-like domain-containing protein, partial [Patescibacteria group bacterium]|nr:Ig-like domain-containing protein [Patescibacteria group bacterium]